MGISMTDGKVQITVKNTQTDISDEPMEAAYLDKVEVVVKKLDNEEEAVPPELVKRTKNMIQIRAEADHEYSIDDEFHHFHQGIR